MLDGEQEFLFVSGAGRTRTTVVAWLLNLHPEVHICYESEFPLGFYNLLHPPVPPTDAGARYKLTWQKTGEQTPHELSLGLHMMRRCWLAQWCATPGTERTGNELVAGFCEAVKNIWPEMRYVGDKAIAYMDNWYIVREMLPTSKFIFAARDFNDTVDSWKRQPWCTDPDAVVDSIKNRLKTARECPGGFWLDTDELEKDPEGCLQGMFDWLDLSMRDYDMEVAVRQIVNPKRKVS